MYVLYVWLTVHPIHTILPLQQDAQFHWLSHCECVTDNLPNLHSITLATRRVIWLAVTPWMCDWHAQFTKLPWQICDWICPIHRSLNIINLPLHSPWGQKHDFIGSHTTNVWLTICPIHTQFTLATTRFTIPLQMCDIIDQFTKLHRWMCDWIHPIHRSLNIINLPVNLPWQPEAQFHWQSHCKCLTDNSPISHSITLTRSVTWLAPARPAYASLLWLLNVHIHKVQNTSAVQLPYIQYVHTCHMGVVHRSHRDALHVCTCMVDVTWCRMTWSY